MRHMHVTVEVSHGSEELCPCQSGLLTCNACLFPLFDHMNDELEILLDVARHCGGTGSGRGELQAFCSTGGAVGGSE